MTTHTPGQKAVAALWPETNRFSTAWGEKTAQGLAASIDSFAASIDSFLDPEGAAFVRQYTPWVVDECLDARGFNTVRVADGTVNGDLGIEPIATVLRYDHADLIAAAPETAAERDRLRAENAELRVVTQELVTAIACRSLKRKMAAQTQARAALAKARDKGEGT